MKTNRITLIACASIAFAGFGCSSGPDFDPRFGTAETSYEVDGAIHPCDTIDETENAFAQDPSSGWKPGCRKFQRMGGVATGDWEGGQFPDDDEDSIIPADDGPAPELMSGDLGQSKQPITIGNGTGLSVTLNASGKILGWNGRCKPLAGTGSLNDTCIVPSKVNFLWEVCPVSICGPQASGTSFMRDRFNAAWTVWRNAISPLTGCGGQGVIPTADSARAFFQPGIVTDEQSYALSTLPIFFQDIQDDGLFLGRLHVFGSMTPFSQVIQRVQYYHYDAAGIIFDELQFELNKAFGCGVTVSQLGQTAYFNAISRGYERVLTHELGHVRGLPHMGTGIMRIGKKQSCEELFQVSQPSANPIGDTVAKARLVVGSQAQMAAIQSMRDSSGVNIVSTTNTSCVEPFSNDSSNVGDFTSD